MTIRRRGNGFQVDVAVDGTRWRGAAETEREAKIIEAQVRADLVAGKPVAQVSRGVVANTLGQLQRRVCAQVWAGTKNEKGAVMNAKAAVRYFGAELPVTAMTTSRIDEYILHLEAAGNSNATINRKLAALSKMLRFAHRRGWIDTMPHFERRQEGQGRIRYLTDVEVARLLETGWEQGYEDHADLWMFLVDTGLRVGEALKLTWADVHTFAGPPGAPHREDRVTVRGSKNGESRTVPLTARCGKMLRSRWVRTKPFGMTYHSARHVIDKIKPRAGLGSDVVLHTMRHTCASRLVQAGVPILTVKEWLGHKSIQVTMRYAHLAPKNLFDAARALEP